MSLADCVNIFPQFRSNGNIFEYAIRLVRVMLGNFLEIKMLYDKCKCKELWSYICLWKYWLLIY